MTAPVRVRIDRLVLEGVAPRDRAALLRAFQAELGRQLAVTPTAATSTPALRLTLPAAGTPAAAGAAAAQAIAQSLGGRR